MSSSAVAELARQVKAVLECHSDASSVSELLLTVDDFVLHCTASQEPGHLVLELEKVLQDVHREAFDHSSVRQTEVFLEILNHLEPIIPPISIISSWFELALRPALREPLIQGRIAGHAKDLVLSALRNQDERSSDRAKEFRRRLFDLYLLDAPNDNSGQDVLDQAELDDRQKSKDACWKRNLEEILLKFASEQPQVYRLQ
jgi:hypothetical protein